MQYLNSNSIKNVSKVSKGVLLGYQLNNIKTLSYLVVESRDLEKSNLGNLAVLIFFYTIN